MKGVYAFVIGAAIGVAANLFEIKLFSLDWWVFVLGLNFLFIFLMPYLIDFFKIRK